MTKPSLAMLLLISLAGTAFADLAGDVTVARKAAKRRTSMTAVYLAPCETPGTLRHWWTPLRTPELDAARAELEQYRNVLGCKSILVYDVAGYERESAFWTALEAGNADDARAIAADLRDTAAATVIDARFVARRFSLVQSYGDDKSLPASTRVRLIELLADARAELAAKRYLAANVILGISMVEAISSGAPPPRSPKCQGFGDPNRAC